MTTNMQETTIATLKLQKNCMLTLTNKHLRGQILRVVDGKKKAVIKDQIDVLLSGIAGYSTKKESRLGSRIIAVVIGILIAFFGSAYNGGDFAPPCVIGGLWAIIGWFANPDRYYFSLNIMGSATLMPIVKGKRADVHRFINELQNAKIAYEENRG